MVPADAATWSLSYGLRSTDFSNVGGVFTLAENHVAKVKTALEKAGLKPEEFIISPLQKRDTTRRNKDGDVTERFFQVTTNVFVSTSEPAKLGGASAAIAALTREGIAINQNPVNYEFTKLNDIKPDMLREATENARIAADQFAENAGVQVGGIQRAIQGGFTVQPANTGDAKNRQLNKLVRVVTTITFYLEN
ncbi:SIMPL domain-containing protein [Pseudahrensia aquimaris]|uniref:SIMPL domain-containing protein n=1 Tax=Pseudahrensia aquimaris TaxID=744461 RepID=A0ABW3FLC1_9HYPH